METMIPRMALCVALVLCAGIGPGCTSIDPLFFDASGQHVKDRPPITNRLAVAPFVISQQLQDAASLVTFEDPGNDMRDGFVEALRGLNVANEVLAVASTDPADATGLDADLFIRPRLNEIAFEYREVSSKWWLSSLLWLTTWVGSTFVEDSTYDARIQVSCEILDMRSGAVVIDQLELASDQVDLDFWERNPVFSLGLLQSMLWPTFWTRDDAEQTHASLARRGFALMAAQLKLEART